MTRRRLTRRVSRPLAIGLALALVGAAGIALAVSTAGDVTVNLNEDDSAVVVGLTGTTNQGSASYTVTSEPSHGSIDEGTGATGSMSCDIVGNCTATIHYTP